VQTSKIEHYFVQRQVQVSLPVRLYGLVDALLYERASGSPPLERSTSAIALFDSTPDASLADAGPWLIDFAQTAQAVRQSLFNLGANSEGASWLISAYPFEVLADELRGRLNARMPDGRTALLRFYDARLIGDIAALLTFTQRIEFFVPTFDWLVQIDDELTRVHPHA
jgi:hypothetical protein